MKKVVFIGLLSVGILFVGCGDKKEAKDAVSPAAGTTTTVQSSSVAVQPVQFSDSNWKNGILVGDVGFFIKDVNAPQINVGDTVEFAFSGKRKVKDVAKQPGTIVVRVDGAFLDPEKDGYPNSVKLVK